LLLAAGTAFADDPPAGGGGGGDATGAGAGSGSAAAGVSATAGGAVAGWGQINDRPLVIPQGKLEVHGGVPILSISVPNAMGGTTSSTLEALSVGGSFGVVDKVQVGLDYAFGLHPNGDVTKGLLGIHGAYAAMKNEKMELAVAANLAISLFGTNAMGNSVTNLGLELGAWFRYKLAEKISIFTGQPALPFTLGGFSSFLAPPIGYQIGIGLNNSQATTLTLPVGVGFQATPQIYTFAELDLAEIYLANGPKDAMGNSTTATLIFKDGTPLGLGAFFSANDQLDLGLTFADDLNHAGDFYVITLAGRYYIK
jgi:hypothetical protein